MSICRRHMRKVCCCLSTAVLTCSTAMAYGVAAQTKETAGELEFEGVTQLSSQDWYLEEDVTEAELVVEEVSVETGSQVREGDPILKLTQESYADATAYYNAAAIKADSNLTDTQLEYDQGMLESQYTYEVAKMKAEQAELVKEYQQTELAETIEDHETVLTELDERIEELESGIAAGSYGTGGTSGSSSQGGSAALGNTGKTSEKESDETAPEGTQEGESETAPERTQEGESETAPEGTQEGESETAPEGTQEGESEIVPEEMPDTESEAEQSETQDTEDETILLLRQIQEKNTQYQEVLEQIERFLAANWQEGETETGEDVSQEQGDETVVSLELSNRIQELQTQLQSSVDGDTNVKTNLENVQKNLLSVPEEVMEVVQRFYPNYQSYMELLESCIAQLEADMQQQQSVKEALNSLNIGGGSDEGAENGAGSNASIGTAEILSLFTQLSQLEEEKNILYEQFISVQNKKIADLEETLQSENGQQPESGLQEEQQSESGLQEGQQPESGQQEEKQPENGLQEEQQPESGQQEEQQQGSGSGGFAEKAQGGTMAGSMTGEMGENASGSSADLTGAGDSGEGTLSDEEISLFGSAYDLTQVKELLEREPSDNDAAQELADQLCDKRETVQRQYDELIRNQNAVKLQIQYTYDTAVLAGELAGFTWEQEKQQWEDQLAQAKSEKADIEEKLEWLSGLEDGIITADRAGVVSGVSYEAGDTLLSDTPLISYYNTDTLTISFEVEQQQIHLLQVGDTVSVSIEGRNADTDAKICEKAIAPTEGTSRTEVKYEVIVSLDNSDGLYSSGASAAIKTNSDQDDETG